MVELITKTAGILLPGKCLDNTFRFSIPDATQVTRHYVNAHREEEADWPYLATYGKSMWKKKTFTRLVDQQAKRQRREKEAQEDREQELAEHAEEGNLSQNRMESGKKAEM